MGWLADFDHVSRFYDWLPIPTDPEPVRKALAGVEGPALDLGGGTGRFTRRLHPDREPRLLVDPSRGMLVRARKAKRDLVPVQADGARLPLPDASIAAVTITEAFHHFAPEESEVLADVARVLQENGALAIQEIDPTRWLGRAIEIGEGLIGFDSVFRAPEELSALVEPFFQDVDVQRTGSFTYLVTACSPLREK